MAPRRARFSSFGSVRPRVRTGYFLPVDAQGGRSYHSRPRAAPFGRDFPFLEASLKDIILTREGYQKLKREIEDLSTRRRREIAERIKVAREFGDIAENAEYDAAKNEQAMVEARIAKLEERLASARVIEKREISKDVVSVGSTVRLRDVDAK